MDAGGPWNARRRVFVAAGILLWITALAAVAAWTATRRGSATPVGRTLDFLAAEPRIVEADLPRGWLWPGDRVLRLDGGRFRACGEVLSLERPVGGATVRLALYPDAGLPDPLPPGTKLLLLDARGTLEWALSRVLSPERRTRLREQLKAMVAEREGFLRKTFGPVLEEFARGVVADVMAELSAFVRTHEDELRGVGEDLLARARERWEPILREQVWPRVLERLEPLGSRVGDELWQALPWGDLASAVAESMGSQVLNALLPADYEIPTNQIAQWRESYVRGVAVPIVERHLPEALEAVGEVVVALSDDPRIQDALRASFLEDGLGNPRVMGLISEAFSAAVLANPRLADRLHKLLDDPRVRRGLFDLAEQLEPRLIALARSFLLDDSGRQLHPELAMLVRVRLIGSEGSWLLLELPPPGTTPPAAPSAGTTRLEILPFEGSTTAIWERPL